ncbi:P-loop containing nucleoside triphosphate hydrolase protein [Xylariaceae sp. AK1471]|nr:P-loop containing nucleoside triphosphate hydrolase protein [Xylariaceae sp. AK1471]
MADFTERMIQKGQTEPNMTPEALLSLGEDIGDNISNAIKLVADAIKESKYAESKEVMFELEFLPSRIESIIRDFAQDIASGSNTDAYLKQVLDDNQELRETIQHYINAITQREVQMDVMSLRLKDVFDALKTRGESVGQSSPNAAEAELKTAREEIQRLNNKLTLSQVPSEEIEDLKTRLAESQELSKAACEMNELLEKEKVEREQANLILTARYNQMVEELAGMKGNVRVVCRIKPEDPKEDLLDITNLHGNNSYLSWTHLRVTTKTNIRTETKDFTFEKVFGNGESNQEIFNEVKDFALTAVLGRPTTIVGFGATGTGKTHTFLSKDGLVQSYISLLFQKAEEEHTQYKYEFHLSAVEIYLDKVYDLLEQPNNGKKVEVRVNSASAVRLESHEAAFEIINKAIDRREVASTSWNAASSRSHAVISLRISKEPITESNEKHSEGIINFLDLAGSEPVGKSMKPGPQDTVSKEGTDILRSLQQMGQAIRAVSTGESFISPGNHSLTKFLRPSLAPNSRLLVVVTISPLKKNQSQTDQTLLWSRDTIPGRGGSAKKKSAPSMIPKKQPASRNRV